MDSLRWGAGWVNESIGVPSSSAVGLGGMTFLPGHVIKLTLRCNKLGSGIASRGIDTPLEICAFLTSCPLLYRLLQSRSIGAPTSEWWLSWWKGGTYRHVDLLLDVQP